QRLSFLAGNHPAQIELRWNTRLRGKGVPVVSIVDGGVQPHGAGCRVWLATPLKGRSLQRVLRDPATPDPRRQSRLRGGAAPPCKVFRAWPWPRDLKPSTIVIDEDGRAWLIDVGSVRAGAALGKTVRTLAVMDRVLARDGVEPALRQLYTQSIKIGM